MAKTIELSVSEDYIRLKEMTILRWNKSIEQCTIAQIIAASEDIQAEDHYLAEYKEQQLSEAAYYGMVAF